MTTSLCQGIHCLHTSSKRLAGNRYNRDNGSVPKIFDKFICSSLAVSLINSSIYSLNFEKFAKMFTTSCLLTILTNQNAHHSCPVKICQHSFKATVDTGASINVIDQNTFTKMKGAKQQKTNIKAFGYNSTKPVNFLGKFEETIETRRRVTVATFYVAKTADGGNLISACHHSSRFRTC